MFLFFAAVWTMAQPVGRSCEASFTYQQDPGNHLIVNFTNTSSGNITDYFWDFGDGSTVHGENPSHAFPYTGEFKVCLTVSGTDTLNPCNDSTCLIVRVDILPQYNLGGLLFAGTYPINNPMSTGDTAFAYLYRFGPSGLIPFDSSYFDTLGYFWFTGITEGKYFLKTGLLESSTRFSQYLPTYHGDCLRWTDADTLFINQNIYQLNIYMIPGNPMTAGTGHIHGWLMMEQTHGGSQPLEAGQVVLADASGTPYYCTYTGSSGEFLFDEVPVGEYQIFSEYTGRFSQKLDLMLDENYPFADSLELMVYAALPGIDDPPSSNPVSVVIFPNPVETYLRVQISLKQPEQIQVKVYNTLGHLIRSTEWQLPAGKFQQELNLEGVPPAIYLISIQDIHSNWRVIKKIIKQ